MTKKKRIAMINYLMLVISSSKSLLFKKMKCVIWGLLKLFAQCDSILRMINAKKKYKELRLAIIPPSLLLLFDVSVWMKFLFDAKKKIKKICEETSHSCFQIELF